ncbi:decarboxylase [Nocardioides aquiterrae]|uniref:Aminotransferase class I/II-fold pyridoxal phosphate-dependent enzyme n=1 Tax=Nocardioides aquiterrae TaxID=203799 RepID=A0ABP4F8S0_9ACTN
MTASLEERLLADAPLLRAWADFVARGGVPFTIPGHQRRAGTLAPLLGRLLDADVPLFGGLDGVNLDHGRLADAQARAAALWGADWCRFSVGGSTHANQSVLLGATRPGDTVLVARNAHRSTLLGLVLSGARPHWLPVAVDAATGLPGGVTESDLATALDAEPGAALVVLVSPSYAGTVTPGLGALVELAHHRGVPVAVDQAWGAHLGFHPDYPGHALRAGADLMVTSAHKGLPAFSQAALVLARTGRVAPERLDRGFEAGDTTSPAGAVLASTDAARALLAQPEGRELLDRAAAVVADARVRLRAAGYAVPGPGDFPPGTFDPAKLVVQRSRADHDLAALGARLAADGMPLEMADSDTLIPVVGLVDPGPAVERLVSALVADAPTGDGAPAAPATFAAPPVPPQALTPRDAFFGVHETVPTPDAVGRVCAEVIAPYPPGVPVLVPGELVTEEALDVLRRAASRGTRIAYAADPSLGRVTVVA